MYPGKNIKNKTKKKTQQNEFLFLCTDVINSSEKLAGGLNGTGDNGELPASYLNS